MKSDIDLEKAVMVRLELDPVLDVTGLGISVKNGVVTLKGKLHDGEERSATERAVKLVRGVKGVQDRIRVEMPETTPPSDAEITVAVADAIQWLTTVPLENIKVSVQDGWVTLKGVVASRHLRETLEDVVRRMPQAKGVNNRVRVESNAANCTGILKTA